MLSSLFQQVLIMSITATVVIVLILLIRSFLKKSPKIYSYILWSVVLLRLLVPFSIESQFSIVPNTSNIVEKTKVTSNVDSSNTEAIEMVETNADSNSESNSEINLDDSNVSDETLNSVNILDSTMENEEPIDVISDDILNINYTQIINVVSIVWILGIVYLISKSIIGLQKLKMTLETAELYKENIYFSENISTAFVLGILTPKIYLPKGLENNAIEYIVKHEKIHIKRRDPLFRFLGFIAVSVHWFNPLVWLAYSKSGDDMEMSCDERVIKELGNDIKKDYSTSLLALATKGSKLKAVPLAFSENNTKFRIKNILNYSKPKFWLVFVSVLVVAVAFVTLLTSPKGNNIVLDVVRPQNLRVAEIKSINIFAPEVNPNEISLQQDDYESFVNLLSNVEIDLSDDMYGIYSSELDSDISIEYNDGRNIEFSIMGNYQSITIRNGEELKGYRVLNPEEFEKTFNENVVGYGTKYNDQYKDLLYNAKTEFVGSASDVGNVIKLLPLNKFVTESTFEITNDGGFNGVIWSVETEEDYINTPELYQSVRLAFDLIENLDMFTIKSHNTVYDYTAQYTYKKEYFEERYNDSEIATSEDREAFNQLIDDILNEDYYKPTIVENTVVNGEEVVVKQAYDHGALMGTSSSKLVLLPKDYTLNVALTDEANFVVMNNGEVYNIEIWEQFLENVNNNEWGTLNIVEYTSNDNAILTNIIYNENEFVVDRDSRRDIDGEQILSTETYKNLVTYSPSNIGNSIENSLGNPTYYYLTNQETITDDDFNNGVDGLLLYTQK